MFLDNCATDMSTCLAKLHRLSFLSLTSRSFLGASGPTYQHVPKPFIHLPALQTLHITNPSGSGIELPHGPYLAPILSILLVNSRGDIVPAAIAHCSKLQTLRVSFSSPWCT